VRRFLFAPIKAKQAQKENVPQAKRGIPRAACSRSYTENILSE
jgi:hypothetical protein